MSFTVEIHCDYYDIDVFYPYKGWEEYCKDDEEKAFWHRCLTADAGNQSAIESVIQEIRDREMAEQETMMMEPEYARIAVDDEQIENPLDFHKLPTARATITTRLRENQPGFRFSDCKFVYLKVWENSGDFSYEGEGEFDEEKLTYENGCFLYDGEGFDLMGGDGSASYEEFYRDGRSVNGVESSEEEEAPGSLDYVAEVINGRIIIDKGYIDLGEYEEGTRFEIKVGRKGIRLEIETDEDEED